MSATEHLIDSLTRHQIMNQRYAGGVIDDLLPIFDRMQESISARLARGVTEYQAGRLNEILYAIDRIVAESNTQFSEELIKQLELFTEYEADFMRRVMDDVISLDMVLPSAKQIIAAVTDSPMTLVSGGKLARMTIPQMLTTFSRKKQGEIRRIIQTGFIEGTPSQQLTREISRITATRTRQQAGTIVRTAVNHMASTARQMTIDENKRAIKEVRWISTLDGRTSEICMGRDQRVYPVDRGPRPPAHFGCRSTIVPIVKTRFTVDGFRGERASKDGPVDARTTYNSWLKSQPVEFQEEVLGKAKAKLFRDGGLHLSKFTDKRGITYNLETLKKLYPIETQRAGI